MAFGDLFSPWLAKLRTIFAPFEHLFKIFTDFWGQVVHGFTVTKELAVEIYDEIQAWRHFNLSVPYRTGVISLPKAVEQAQDIVDAITSAWGALVDLVKSIGKQLEKPISAAEEAAGEVSSAFEEITSSGFKFFEKFPRLTKALGKFLEIFAVVSAIVDEYDKTIDELKTIVDSARTIREDLENGIIFLGQSNPRKTLKLADGGSIKIRVGSLHHT